MRHRLRSEFPVPCDRRFTPLRRAAGFTLIEILVVLGIIVLLIALAVPAFSFITGSRSSAAATNQISAALSIARAKAVGLQQVAGVMFFIEPTSDRVQMALVQQVEPPTGVATSGPPTGIDVFLDLVSDTEFVKLPAGVGVQTVTNAMGAVGSTADRYIGFNDDGMSSSKARQTLRTKVGGVILFDGNGQLVAHTYCLRTNKGAGVASRMGALLFYDPDPTVADRNSETASPADYIALRYSSTTTSDLPVSQLGMVLFDQNAFAAKGFTLADQRVTGTAETIEEDWLDQNATPTMVNRYNGTLVAGE